MSESKCITKSHGSLVSFSESWETYKYISLRDITSACDVSCNIGYIASYEKHEGLRIVYDELEQAALGAQTTQVPSSLENNNNVNIALDQLPRCMITKATPTFVQIEGWWDFLPWSDTEELLRKMSDHRMTFDLDLDPEVRLGDPSLSM